MKSPAHPAAKEWNAPSGIQSWQPWHELDQYERVPQMLPPEILPSDHADPFIDEDRDMDDEPWAPPRHVLRRVEGEFTDGDNAYAQQVLDRLEAEAQSFPRSWALQEAS